MISFKLFISEDVHPKIKAALNSPAKEIKTKVSILSRQIMARGEDPGIRRAGVPHHGSSRATFPLTKDHQFTLDGNPASTKTVLKVAYEKPRTSIKNPNKQGPLVGQFQNKAETSWRQDEFRTFIKGQNEGEWHTNPNGIVPTVFSHDKTRDADSRLVPKWVHSEYARPLKSEKEFMNFTKTSIYPEGIDTYDIDHMIQYGHTNHPLVNTIRDMFHKGFRGDFKLNNWGVVKHPHTGEEKLVIRDTGMNDETTDFYDLPNGRSFDEYNKTKNKFNEFRKTAYREGKRPMKLVAKRK